MDDSIREDAPYDEDDVVEALVLGASASSSIKVYLVINPDGQALFGWEEGAFDEWLASQGIAAQTPDTYAEGVRRREEERLAREQQEALRVQQAAEYFTSTVIKRRRWLLPLITLDLLYWIAMLIIQLTDPDVMPPVPEREVGAITAEPWINIADVPLAVTVCCIATDILGVAGAMQRRHMLLSLFLLCHAVTTVVVSLQGLSFFILWRAIHLIMGFWTRTAIALYQIMAAPLRTAEDPDHHNTFAWELNNCLAIMQGFCCLLLGFHPSGPGYQDERDRNTNNNRPRRQPAQLQSHPLPSNTHSVTINSAAPMPTFAHRGPATWSAGGVPNAGAGNMGHMAPYVPGWNAPVFLPVPTRMHQPPMLSVTNTVSMTDSHNPRSTGSGLISAGASNRSPGPARTPPGLRQFISSMLPRSGASNLPSQRPVQQHISPQDSNQHLLSMPMAGGAWRGMDSRMGPSRRPITADHVVHHNPHYRAPTAGQRTPAAASQHPETGGTQLTSNPMFGQPQSSRSAGQVMLPMGELNIDTIAALSGLQRRTSLRSPWSEHGAVISPDGMASHNPPVMAQQPRVGFSESGTGAFHAALRAAAQDTRFLQELSLARRLAAREPGPIATVGSHAILSNPASWCSEETDRSSSSGGTSKTSHEGGAAAQTWLRQRSSLDGVLLAGPPATGLPTHRSLDSIKCAASAGDQQGDAGPGLGGVLSLVKDGCTNVGTEGSPSSSIEHDVSQNAPRHSRIDRLDPQPSPEAPAQQAKRRRPVQPSSTRNQSGKVAGAPTAGNASTQPTQPPQGASGVPLPTAEGSARTSPSESAPISPPQGATRMSPPAERGNAPISPPQGGARMSSSQQLRLAGIEAQALRQMKAMREQKLAGSAAPAAGAGSDMHASDRVASQLLLNAQLLENAGSGMEHTIASVAGAHATVSPLPPAQSTVPRRPPGPSGTNEDLASAIAASQLLLEQLNSRLAERGK